MKYRIRHNVWVLSLAALLATADMGLANAVEEPRRQPQNRPNIIIVLADDISARELPIYGSTVWTPPHSSRKNHSISDLQYRAQTPVLDRLAEEGCYIQNAWGATICSASRAMLMTGRYAHRHKWWFNHDIGTYVDADGKRNPWPLYKSSPLLIGHVAQLAGYRTLWAGKTQMYSSSDLTQFGFDSILSSPGPDSQLHVGEEFPEKDNLYGFRLMKSKTESTGYVVRGSGQSVNYSWLAASFYWQPFVRLINVPFGANNDEWWPNTPESKAAYGVNTYGPDVELDSILKFMEQQHDEQKPFFVYYASHLGHDAFDFLGQNGTWTGTPVIKRIGEGYVRTEPGITGDKGVYDTHGTVTSAGIHHQINYLDYQVGLIREKLKAMGVEDNTVIIFTADNGTAKYGKGTVVRQRGTHIPMIIYAPNMTKHGKQDILVDLADILPTIADVAGVSLPDDYELNGKSLWPYLTSNKKNHRDYIYSYQGEKQIIRGHRVLRDGNGRWWNVENEPADLDSYPKIKDWSRVLEVHRAERDKLESILPRFDKHATQHDAP